jgi:integrase
MVIQTLQFVQSQGLLLLEPKTEKSRRMIVLPGFVKEALRIHLTRRGVMCQGLSWKESGLVFTTDIGTAINPHNMFHHFKDHLKEAGLPDIKFHLLRHSVASILLQQNTHPKIVAELLGHSSINLTLNPYSHIINPMNTVAGDAIQKTVRTL